MRPDELDLRARRWARRRPAWWLRHRERTITSRTRPDQAELATLAAIRRELRRRAANRRRRRL